MIISSDTNNNTIKDHVVKQLSAFPLIKKIFDKLNIKQIIKSYCPIENDIDVGTVAEILIANRLMAPLPLCNIVDWAKETIIPEIYNIPAKKLNDDKLGTSLDRIYPAINDIWAEIAVKACQICSDEIKEILYDITSIYFTGDYESSENIVPGYSRDKKQGTPQIELGLNVTAKNGVLIHYKYLKGNTADITTVLDNIAELKKIFQGLEKSDQCEPLIITDRAMITALRIIDYLKNGFHYLSMYRTTNETKRLAIENLEKLNNSVFDRKGDKFYGIKTPFQVPYNDENTNKKNQLVDTTLFIFKSETKAKSDCESRNKIISEQKKAFDEMNDKLNYRLYKKKSYVENRIKNISKKGKYFITEVEGSDGDLKLNYSLDQVKIDEESKFDGIFYAVSDLNEMSPAEALDKLKNRDFVERRIKVLKSTIKVRPIFLELDERIESLVFIIMISLLVYSLLEKEIKDNVLDLTVKSVFNILATLYAIITIFDDGGIAIKISKPSSQQKTILRRFGVFSFREYEKILSGFT